MQSGYLNILTFTVMRKATLLIFALLSTGCWREVKVSSEMWVVRTPEGYRVVGFVPAEPLRERAYFFVLLSPLSLTFVSGRDTVPVFADLHVLTMDKQRRIDRAFLVSSPLRYPPNGGEILMRRMGRVVGRIELNLKRSDPNVLLDSFKVVRFRGKYHTYVWLTAVPSAKNYPRLILAKGEDSVSMLPVERARFLTMYRGREYHMYQEWYDRWIFVLRSDTPLPLRGYTFLFRGELFGAGDTSVVVLSADR